MWTETRTYSSLITLSDDGTMVALSAIEAIRSSNVARDGDGEIVRATEVLLTSGRIVAVFEPIMDVIERIRKAEER